MIVIGKMEPQLNQKRKMKHKMKTKTELELTLRNHSWLERRVPKLHTRSIGNPPDIIDCSNENEWITESECEMAAQKQARKRNEL